MKKHRHSALTDIINRSIMSLMNTKNITPESYETITKKQEEAREARGEQIYQMRESDPEYWTFERLAKHWKTSKQNVQWIYEKVKKEKGR